MPSLTERTGRLVASVTGWKDEAFLERLSDEVHRGLRGQVERGLATGGRAYGYRSEPVVENGQVVSIRRVIDPTEAEIVRYIYRVYSADGLAPKAIAHRLNKERVSPPRGPRGRVTGSWTPSTILGPRQRLLGILRNPMYAGKIVWNRSRKIRNPDTDKRIMRVRPQSEWIWKDAPDLRIVPDDLWERAQARLQQRAWAPGGHGGTHPKYLLSGLLVCSSCGGRYVVQKRRAAVGYYACAVHFDRGQAVCPNSRLVRKDRVEEVILSYVFGDLFAPHRLAYLCRAVDDAMERMTKQSADTAVQREAALRDARRELENIKNAIRAGIITPTTKSMLENAEHKVATLEQAARASRQRSVPVVSMKSVVERYLRDLRATLETNVDEARRLLRLALDQIMLRVEGEHVVARISGNMAGLLTLAGPDVVASTGAGRGISVLATMPPEDRIVA